MEFIKKYQYTLLLYGISLLIIATGVLPNGGKLLHRYAYPEEYQEVQATIIQLEPYRSLQQKANYHVTVEFTLQGTRHQAVLGHYVEEFQLDMEIPILVQEENPQNICQSWYQWQTVILHSCYAFLGLLVGHWMTIPPSPTHRPRKPRSLRERLDIYTR